jgi:T5orf172 domain
MPEVIYVLTNEAMPGLVKIGITSGDVSERIKQLDNTSIPLPFECFYAAEVTDAAKAEKAIHTAFGDHRVRPSREFFKLSPDKPKAILELLCLKVVTPGSELFTEPGDKEAVGEAKKRRAIFSFATVPQWDDRPLALHARCSTRHRAHQPSSLADSMSCRSPDLRDETWLCQFCRRDHPATGPRCLAFREPAFRRELRSDPFGNFR